ncbi:MAG: STAS domain-containing protein [Planctomycetota bacterium]|jgi:anti-anti-sigma factor
MPEPQVISIQPHAAATIVTIKGPDLDLPTIESMYTQIAAAAAGAPALPVVLSLAEIQYANSYAITTLLRLREDLQRAGQRFVLVDVGPFVRQTLAITRLERVFEILEDTNAALEALVN